MTMSRNHKSYLAKIRAITESHDLSELISPYLGLLDQAFRKLNPILEELRGDETTDKEFQQFIIEILDNGDYSAKTLCGLMHTYCKTHNDQSGPNRKPIVGIAQESFKILSNIDDLCRTLTDMRQEKEYLKHALKSLK